ncbi:putative amino acid transporter, transmembrane domain-containing protein [Helianthus annuus]|uniref:Amino acid transporter, transmembrane domain-containing protein n=1 Tax=Helianthus annuus TaxID=4232 RepID=A0A9K3JN16_HELAN|nr:putative amino acid transporter, transmembrane domain-containing protein [Helianthus annuus]
MTHRGKRPRMPVLFKAMYDAAGMRLQAGHQADVQMPMQPSCSNQKIMYSSISPDGPLHLWQFIAMVTVVMMVLSQLPMYHSLRQVNLASLFLSLAYTFIVVGVCIHAGLSKDAPARGYSLESSTFSMVMSAFTSISIIAAIFGNGIVLEIQVSSLMSHPNRWRNHRGAALSETDCSEVSITTIYIIQLKIRPIPYPE